MYSTEVKISDAVITAIHHKVADDKVQTRITVTGTLLPNLAERLDVRGLIFAENGTPKGGFSSLALDTGCAAFRAVFEADPALKQSFELTSGDSTDQYTVARLAEGVMQLKLRLNYHGDPHRALAYVMAIGNGQSKLRIVPLQTEIPAKAEPEEEEDQERLFDPEITHVRQKLTRRQHAVHAKLTLELPMFCRHHYGWPRRVDGRDLQTCTRCGATRDSKIQFGTVISNRPRLIQFSGRLNKAAAEEPKTAWKRGEVQC